ncbi:hypothetical protein C8R43DRAFT_575839 [Mycena crocata]|nr:hypothetical protein C8R43DRAFT_575839 [Mycena crocata]
MTFPSRWAPTSLHPARYDCCHHPTTETRCLAVFGPCVTPVTGPGLGSLSNRAPQYQHQNSLIVDKHGRLRFAALSRRVLSLPPEILSKIFIQSLYQYVSPDLYAAPLLFCGVCRQFRDVAIGTPELWSSLHIEFANLEEDNASDASYIRICQAWLTRARTTPISLSFIYTDKKYNGLMASLLQTVAQLSPQWRNMDIQVKAEWALSLLFPAGLKFPLLEKLEIATNRDGRGLLHPPITFLDAPKLREVVSVRLCVDVLLPWRQLTTIQSETDPLSCLKMLREAPNLVDVNFEIWDDSPLSPALPIIPLLRLQSLTLDATRAVELIDCLRTPALKCLDLSFGNEPMLSPSFASFISRSCCKLHSLTLASTPINAETLVQCLQATPSLVHLQLRAESIQNINDMFTSLTGNPDFLPRLESMDVYSTYSPGMPVMPPSLVVEMLCWRWAAVGIARLRSFEFKLSHFVDSKWDEAVNSHLDIRRLKDEGMVLDIGTRKACYPRI